MPETGDPLHDAFFALLQTVAAAVGVASPWRIVDTRNTLLDLDAGSAPYIDFEILPGGEDQASFGAPGENWHLEAGQITVNFNMLPGKHIAEAGRHANAMIARFRTQDRTFMMGDREVTLSRPVRLGAGESEAGDWVESFALTYELYNIG